METEPNSLPQRLYFSRLSGNQERRYELHAYVIASSVCAKDEAVWDGYQTGRLGITGCWQQPRAFADSLESAKGDHITPKTSSLMLATSRSFVFLQADCVTKIFQC